MLSGPHRSTDLASIKTGLYERIQDLPGRPSHVSISVGVVFVVDVVAGSVATGLHVILIDIVIPARRAYPQRVLPLPDHIQLRDDIEPIDNHIALLEGIF